MGMVDEWFRTAPYASAFTVTAVKATASDLLAQTRGRMAQEEGRPASPNQPIVWRRTMAFLLYGGAYQGCAQYYLFNVLFPQWFGAGDDFGTVATKVLFDQMVVTPFVCLPVAYLIKAIAFGEPPAEGLRRYAADARRDLLFKYWAIWTPTQCLTFGVVPQQYRIPFIAFVSFFWLIVLSTISARGDASVVAAAASEALAERDGV